MSGELHLELPFAYSAADREFIYELASTFLLHILYVRSVIPLPFVQLGEECRRISSLAKVSSAQKRFLKAVHDTGEVLASLREAFQHLDVQTITVLLGPSAISAKEVFHLHFISGGSLLANTGAKQLNMARRRVVQKLIEHQCNVDNRAPTRPKFYVAINVAENEVIAGGGSVGIGGIGGIGGSGGNSAHALGNAYQQAGVEAETAWIAPAAQPLVGQTSEVASLFKYFSYRDPFKVRVRKRGPPVVHLAVTSADAVAPLLDSGSGSTNASGNSSTGTEDNPQEPIDAVHTAYAGAGAGATAPAGANVVVAGSGSKWLVQKRGIKAIKT
ncbi:hypothetical protein B484DRAFT_459650 [Ochromonadaceae sp. CCMP2298]|nr:hypothetical protein B484DRAFT_459650 [Ochromonadaceae sp. CCMP2298]